MRTLHADSHEKKLEFHFFSCELAVVGKSQQTKAGQGIAGEIAPHVKNSPYYCEPACT